MKGATITRKPETQPKGMMQKRSSYLPFADLRKEMDKWFEDFLHGYEHRHLPSWEEFQGELKTHVDIRDNDDELIVTAELPGVKLEDIDLTVSPDSLLIQGEKREEQESKEKGQYRLERRYGSFTRQLPLPCEIEQDRVEASFKDGVLKVTMPKSKESMDKNQKVQVKKG